MTEAPLDRCPNCGKPLSIHVCDRVEKVATRLRVVILQHPQEDDELLGTAPLVKTTLPNSEVRVGLSWASLDHALGSKNASKDRWAVLAAAKLPVDLPAVVRAEPVILVDRNGRVRDLEKPGLDGIIVLDDGKMQVFVRAADIAEVPPTLAPRQRVEFEIGVGELDPQAFDVRSL